MAALISGDLLPRYCPGIDFPAGTDVVALRNPPFGVARLDPARVPGLAYLVDSHKTLPEFIAISAEHAVSEPARDLIEAFEPGVHRFYPVRVVRAGRSQKPIVRLDGRDPSEPYYLFKPQVMLDAVCIERSGVNVSVIAGRAHVTPNHKRPVVLRRAVVAGHHVWLGQYEMPRKMFFSDALAREIEKRKWKGLSIKYLEEA